MQNLLYFLPILICPIAMGLMMWFMMRSMHGTQSSGISHSLPGQPSSPSMSPLMQRETLLARLPSDTSADDVAGRMRDERLADLRARLSTVQEEQRLLAHQIAELDGALRPEPAQQSHQM